MPDKRMSHEERAQELCADAHCRHCNWVTSQGKAFAAVAREERAAVVRALREWESEHSRETGPGEIMVNADDLLAKLDEMEESNGQ